MKKAFIIKNQELICYCETNLKNGEIVEYSYQKSEESINANRDFNLVNARTAKISRAKKWLKIYEKSIVDSAIEINEGEFYVL